MVLTYLFPHSSPVGSISKAVLELGWTLGLFNRHQKAQAKSLMLWQSGKWAVIEVLPASVGQNPKPLPAALPALPYFVTLRWVVTSLDMGMGISYPIGFAKINVFLKGHAWVCLFLFQHLGLFQQ